jgi:hypothetical protein
MSRRRWLWGALLAVGVGVLLYLAWPRRAWEIILETDRAAGAPWSTFALTAHVRAPGAGGPVATAGWRWRWAADGAALSGDSPARSWRSGRPGTHRVTVTATDTRGTSKTAAIELVVRKVGVVDDLRGRVAPATQPIDPSMHDVPFAFADIVVEKSAVCVGEPALIRATATAPGGTAGNLIAVIGGVQGFAGSFIRLGGEPGMRSVVLTLRDPDLPGRFAQEEVFIELKDCHAPATLLVDATLDRIVPDRYTFATKLIKFERGKVPTDVAGTAASYSWDFGDGEKLVTREPVVGHTFPAERDRPAAAHFHTYLVTVEARDAAGTRLAKGHAPVFFYNLRRQSRDKLGLVELVARFRDLAESDEKGNRSLAVTLENIDDTQTVSLTEVRLRNLSCDGKTETESTVPVGSVFPQATIGPRGSVAGALTVEEPAKRNLCRVFAAVKGTSSPGGLEAAGSFAVTVGDAFRQPVTDARQLEVVKQITAILGTPGFTEEDVRRLEDEGRIPRGALQRPGVGPPPPPPRSGTIPVKGTPPPAPRAP